MIIASRKKVLHARYLYIKNITQTDYIKYLGIYIDNYISILVEYISKSYLSLKGLFQEGIA